MYKKLTLLYFFLIVFLPALLLLGLRDLPANIQPGFTTTIKIYGEKVIEQYFLPRSGNLSGIGLSIKNANLLNKNDLVLEIREGDLLLRKAVVSGYVIPDGDFVKFRFDPVAVNETDQLSFVLSSPHSTSETYFETFLASEEPFGSTSLMYEGETLESDVSYVLLYKPVWRELTLSVYNELFARLSRDSVFTFLYGLVLTATLTYLLLFRKKG